MKIPKTPKSINVVATIARAFAALTPKQFERLYAARGGPVLCGEDADSYAKDGVY